MKLAYAMLFAALEMLAIAGGFTVVSMAIFIVTTYIDAFGYGLIFSVVALCGSFVTMATMFIVLYIVLVGEKLKELRRD